MNRKLKIGIAILMMAVIVSGCVSQPSQSQSTNVGSNSGPDKQKEIIVKYSAKTIATINDFAKPKAGNVFLVITMTIENHGYDTFNTNMLWFSVTSNNIKHDASFETGNLADKIDTVDLLDGGSTKGSIAFEVPAGTTDYSIIYKQIGRDYNVVYQKQ